MVAEALAQILEELRQIKQDVRWLREREEGRQTADMKRWQIMSALLGGSRDSVQGSLRNRSNGHFPKANSWNKPK
jgi:hypothetical protein